MATILSERLFKKLEAEFRPHVDALGIDPAIFTDPAIEIPVEKYAALLEMTACNGTPDIGLKLAKAVEPADFGVLGHAMANAPTVLKVLETLTRYIYVFAQDNLVRVDIGGKSAVLSYRFVNESVRDRRQDAEFATATIYRLISIIAERAVTPRYVEFEHVEPDYASVHREIFQCPVYYSRGGNRVHFDKKVLRYEIEKADPRLFEALEFYLADKLKLRSQDDDLLLKIRHVIATSIHAGIPDLDDIAQKIGMSKRTLQRRLASEGVDYSDIVDMTRKSIAVEYVTHTDYKLSDIGAMVGYEEASSFTRAFRRWTGASPLSIRKGKGAA